MVKVCSDEFNAYNVNITLGNSKTYDDIFESYAFKLSNFQKWSIYSIVNENHTLVTAHTGCGKTLPAEFAIQHFVSKGKKVIYTSPIKALSNQKFKEFSEKFPNISCGILTGDVKYNPDGDVLIMTTEILRNKLLTMDITTSFPSISHCSFDMNIRDECGCVIFDEVHYLDNDDRGCVWEQSIMNLPKHIPMVMLSASIGNPENMASWVENIKGVPVNICGTNERIVPLQHFSFFTFPTSILDKIEDKHQRAYFEKHSNQLMILKDKETNVMFKTETMKIVNDMKSYCLDNHVVIQRKFVMDKIVDLLYEKQMLPALCFVLSRKQVEKIALNISKTLFTEQELYDDPVPNTIEKYVRQKLVSKLVNWKEYVETFEYKQLVSCLKRGVGYHHAGMIPILKEIVETLYAERKIKFLVATETFAIGLNMPTKTVLFSSLYKFSGETNRLFHGHEYTQMAGRAGRRGIDKIGYIIHLNNLFDTPYSVSYKQMMNSQPQKVRSRFKMSLPYVLCELKKYKDCNCDLDEEQFVLSLESKIVKSFMNIDIKNQIIQSSQTIVDIEKRIENIKTSLCYSENLLEQYHEMLTQESLVTSQKQKKQLRQKISKFRFPYPKLDSQYHQYISLLEEYQNKNQETKMKIYGEEFIQTTIRNILNILKETEFVSGDFEITSSGIVACSMMECHGLAFAKTLESYDNFDKFGTRDIICLLSCFYPFKQSDDKIKVTPSYSNQSLNECALETKRNLDLFFDLEVKNNLDIGFSYDFQYDLMNLLSEWYDIESMQEANVFVSKLKQEYNIFPGEFSKCCMKIINCVEELKSLCNFFEFFELLEKINKIPNKLMKFIIHSETIYI